MQFFYNRNSEFYSFYTKKQLKTIQKIKHDIEYMDYAVNFCLKFYWALVLYINKENFNVQKKNAPLIFCEPDADGFMLSDACRLRFQDQQ